MLFVMTIHTSIHTWRANQHEHACFGISSLGSFPSSSGILLHAVVQPWILCTDLFRHEKRSAHCSAVLRRSPSSWATVVHRSALIPCCCCCFSHSAHWLPTRKKTLYTVANPARGLLNREKKKKKKSCSAPPPPHPPARCSFGEKK